MTDDGAGGVIASRGQDVRNTHIQMTSCLPSLSPGRAQAQRRSSVPQDKTQLQLYGDTVIFSLAKPVDLAERTSRNTDTDAGRDERRVRC